MNTGITKVLRERNFMFKKILTTLVVALFLYFPTTNAMARGHYYSHSHSNSYSSYHSSSGGSHHVKGYYRKNGTYVRPHYAGNKHSGNHWHLNQDGSDTLTKPNGSTVTIPFVQ